MTSFEKISHPQNGSVNINIASKGGGITIIKGIHVGDEIKKIQNSARREQNVIYLPPKHHTVDIFIRNLESTFLKQFCKLKSTDSAKEE